MAAITVCVNRTVAQTRNNQSDWNVPPPVIPGTITKGSTNKNGAANNKQITLTLTDVPVVSQPAVSPVPVPVLAAVSTTPPPVNAPDQPLTGQDGLPDIPSPDAPEAPALPKQSLKDLPVATSSMIDLPLPESPELPPAPTEPTPSGVSGISNGSVPLMPNLFDSFPLSLNSADVIPWSVPVLPESLSFKLIMPADEKNSKPGGKAIKRNKPHAPRRK
ncbi:hypothetical protein [Mucilaginibacter celer]|uniref:hypothetical protein n=1 Tax=Mucilaginibacter celer TaxID=2305508 RepID=UPI0013CEB139|nr:hypothetical protein [Mucilaginibacter celer]